MKTTVEIQDALLLRAKHYARENGTTLLSVLEEGLRRTLDEPRTQKPYTWPDLSVGSPDGEDPLAGYSREELRDLIYEDRWDTNK